MSPMQMMLSVIKSNGNKLRNSPHRAMTRFAPYSCNNVRARTDDTRLSDAGVTNNVNNDCVPFRRDRWSLVFITDTFAFPAMTCKNVHHEECLADFVACTLHNYTQTRHTNDKIVTRGEMNPRRKSFIPKFHVISECSK